MSYYKEKYEANKMIDNIIQELKSKRKSGYIPEIVLQVSQKFQVSNKIVLDRLELLKKTSDRQKKKPFMNIEGEFVKWS